MTIPPVSERREVWCISTISAAKCNFSKKIEIVVIYPEISTMIMEANTSSCNARHPCACISSLTRRLSHCQNRVQLAFSLICVLCSSKYENPNSKEKFIIGIGRTIVSMPTYPSTCQSSCPSIHLFCHLQFMRGTSKFSDYSSSHWLTSTYLCLLSW